MSPRGGALIAGYGFSVTKSQNLPHNTAHPPQGLVAPACSRFDGTLPVQLGAERGARWYQVKVNRLRSSLSIREGAQGSDPQGRVRRHRRGAVVAQAGRLPLSHPQDVDAEPGGRCDNADRMIPPWKFDASAAASSTLLMIAPFARLRQKVPVSDTLLEDIGGGSDRMVWFGPPCISPVRYIGAGRVTLLPPSR